MSAPRGVTPLLIASAVLVGLTVGIGLFTFGYAEGLSYFSTDPRACVNCHIMNDQYTSWTKSTHHAAARCVDCHLPHALLPKLIAKAANGWHHSKAFTLGNFHQPIMIKERNAAILQEGCLSCHGELVHQLVAGSTSARNAIHCVHCHADVGHGPRQ